MHTALLMGSRHPFSSLTENVLAKKGYKIEREVGCGSYSKVKQVWSSNHKQYLAAKIINLRTAKAEFRLKFLPRELNIVKQINHPNLIKVYDTIVTFPLVCIMEEYAPQGTLLNLVILNQRIPEPQAKTLFRQLLEATHYLHRKQIAHRDIKCENILLDQFLNLKLADFDFIRYMRIGEMSTTYCGSTAYTAPEILTGTPYYGCTCDIWSIGVVLYVMVTGLMPFDDRNPPRMIKKQLRHEITYHYSVRKFTCKEVKQLIKDILNPRPDQRVTYEQIVNSNWMKDTPWVVRTETGICGLMEAETVKGIHAMAGPGKKAENRQRDIVTNLCNFGVSADDSISLIMEVTEG